MNCQICTFQYTSNAHKPYSIIKCGHTFCESCINNLTSKISTEQETATCPKCKEPIKGKIINYAILDVLDLNLVPDANVALKSLITKSVHELQELDNQFFQAYEHKVKENKERIKLLKEEINNQTIDLINQIKQNRINLFKHADQLEIGLNDSLVRFVQAEQHIEMNISDFTCRLKQIDIFERNELNLFKDQIEKCRFDFAFNIKEMKNSLNKLDFKKFSNNPNLNYIGNISYEPTNDKGVPRAAAAIVHTPRSMKKHIVDDQNKKTSEISSEQINVSHTTKLDRKHSLNIPNSHKSDHSFKMLTSIKINSNKIKSLCCLSNGLLASGTRDGNLMIHNIKSGALINTFKFHLSTINCISCLNEDLIVTGSNDTSIKIWKFENGDLKQTLTGHSGFVYCICILPNGVLASGSDDCTIKLWDTNKSLNVKTLKGHTYSVLCLCVLKNGYIASGSADTHIKIWSIEADPASTKSVKTFTGHSNSINSLCLINDNLLASASNDKTIKIWSMNGDLIRTLTGHKDYVATICPLSEYLLASGSLDSVIKIFDLQTGEVIKNLTDHFDWVTSLALFKNGKYFASSSNDDTIKIWSL